MSIPLKVSVCIPTYNHAQFIEDAIRSVLSQTFTDYELLVIDNCSTDNTREVVAPYLSHDARVKYIRNEANIGLGGNLNRCLEFAMGEYVKILPADDLLAPVCIEKMARILDDNPRVTLVGSARILADKNLKPLSHASYATKVQLIRGTDVIKKCFFIGNLIGEPTAVLFRKSDAERGFNTNYKQLIDLEFWFHLLEKGYFSFTPEALCTFRQHSRQESAGNLSSFAFLADELSLYRDYIVKGYLGESFLNKFRWKFKISYMIWRQKFNGIDTKTINGKIRAYLPLSLFYPMLMVALILKWSTITSRGLFLDAKRLLRQ